METQIRPVLAGRKALVVGIANDQSIAYGCAKAFRMAGADLAITWLNEKARPHVEPLAAELDAQIMAPLDVSNSTDLEALFQTIGKPGAGSTFSCIRSPSRPRPICKAAFSIAPPKALPRRWTFPAIPSCGWRSSLRR